MKDINNMTAAELNSFIKEVQGLKDEKMGNEAVPICEEISRLIGQLNDMGIAFFDMETKQQVQYVSFNVIGQGIDTPMVTVRRKTTKDKKRG